MRLSKELRDRTKRYASSVIQLYMSLPRHREEVQILGKQALRSGTSVAAHAREASRARSDSEFCSKIDVLLQEADETQLWTELLREDCRISDNKLGQIWEESEQLISVFTSIVSKVRKKG